jgi:predicted AAA+ superfamily ATPase
LNIFYAEKILDYFVVNAKIVRMKRRYLHELIKQFAFNDHKMAFVSGPRQCGKTTLGHMLAREREISEYYNWDNIQFRRQWTKSPESIIPEASKLPLVILDEIHKDRTWKRTLKGIYDTIKFNETPCDIFVTGSSRLNVYRRGSDSLLGRYYHFRLAPFSLREMETAKPLSPDETLEHLKNHTHRSSASRSTNIKSLLKFGPFPEPLFRQEVSKWRLWRKNRHEMIIREDLRDIGRSSDLGKIEMLASILPEKIGSPLSINSLRSDIEVAHQTLQRWIGWLKELYFLFEIKPWSKKITRSIKKEGKIYLWDFSEIENEAVKFENLVAMHLKKTCDYWNDSGQGDFALYYLRNKEKEEVDFLIIRDGKAWLPVEVKVSDTTPSRNWEKFLPLIGCELALQVVNKSFWKRYKREDSEILVGDAAEILQFFI